MRSLLNKYMDPNRHLPVGRRLYGFLVGRQITRAKDILYHYTHPYDGWVCANPLCRRPKPMGSHCFDCYIQGITRTGSRDFSFKIFRFLRSMKLI